MAKKFQPVSWTAEEYIIRSHNAWWYAGLAAVVIVLSVVAGLLEAWSFLVLILLSAVAILVSNLRPPRKLNYTLDEIGLTEGQKLYKYEDYKAFGILKEENNFSAVLIPKKRFGLQVKVYFPGSDGEAIVDALGARLPMEEVKLDFIDKIVNFLRI